VHGTEMASDLTESFIINDALHSDRETTLSSLSCGNFTRVLTSSQKNVELLDVLAVEKWRN